ncbi:hypothetical protein ACOMHN_050000 [Nucella lapillus]
MNPHYSNSVPSASPIPPPASAVVIKFRTSLFSRYKQCTIASLPPRPQPRTGTQEPQHPPSIPHQSKTEPHPVSAQTEAQKSEPGLEPCSTKTEAHTISMKTETQQSSTKAEVSPLSQKTEVQPVSAMQTKQLSAAHNNTQNKPNTARTLSIHPALNDKPEAVRNVRQASHSGASHPDGRKSQVPTQDGRLAPRCPASWEGAEIGVAQAASDGRAGRSTRQGKGSPRERRRGSSRRRKKSVSGSMRRNL